MADLLGWKVGQDIEKYTRQNLNTSSAACFGPPTLPFMVEAPSESRREHDYLVSVLGRVTDTMSFTALAPLDRVRLLMQNQTEMIISRKLSRPYLGIRDCFARTIKQDGFMSLWRGNTAQIINTYPSYVMKLRLSNYLWGEFLYINMNNSVNQGDFYFRTLALHCLVHPCQLLFSHPLDFAQTRLATDVKAPINGWQFKGLLDVYRKILKSDGISGIYRGYPLSCVSNIANSTVSSTVVSEYMQRRQMNKLEYSVLTSLMLGVQVMVFYPMDTLVRRLMMTSGEADKYRGITDAFYLITKREGFLSLYKGAAPFALHQFVANIALIASTNSLNRIARYIIYASTHNGQ